MINKEAWDSLPPDLQSLLETTCQSITTDMVAEYTNGNSHALQQLLENPDVEIRPFPKEVTDLLKSITDEIVAEWVANDPLAAKIAESYYEFLERAKFATSVTEQAYLEAR